MFINEVCSINLTHPLPCMSLQHFKEKLESEPVARIQELAKFIYKDVYFAASVSANLSTGIRFFSTSHDKGKQLEPVDALKGYMFDSSAMAEARQVQE